MDEPHPLDTHLDRAIYIEGRCRRCLRRGEIKILPGSDRRRVINEWIAEHKKVCPARSNEQS
jgi:hypothetical protein